MKGDKKEEKLVASLTIYKDLKTLFFSVRKTFEANDGGSVCFYLKERAIEDESTDDEIWQAGFKLNPPSGTMMPRSQNLLHVEKEKINAGRWRGVRDCPWSVRSSLDFYKAEDCESRKPVPP